MTVPAINWSDVSLPQALLAIRPALSPRQDISLTSLLVLQCLRDRAWPGISVYRRAFNPDGHRVAQISMLEQGSDRLDVFGRTFDQALELRRWHACEHSKLPWDEFYPSHPDNDKYYRSVLNANATSTKPIEQALDKFALDLTAAALSRGLPFPMATSRNGPRL